MLEISPEIFIFLKRFNSECQAIEIWFTDQSGQPLEIEDIIRINLTYILKNATNYWWIKISMIR